LYIAFELSDKEWKLAISNAERQARIVSVPARDLAGVEAAIAKARQSMGLRSDCEVCTCYEAGRDGFWLARELLKRGYKNLVVDSSSIETSRRSKHVKTDNVDAGKLQSLLLRHWRGEKVWSVVQVPPVEIEDQRQFDRERENLLKERTAHTNRIKGLLIAVGVKVEGEVPSVEALDTIKNCTGEKLQPQLKRRLQREYARLDLVRTQLKELEGSKKEVLAKAPAVTPKIFALTQLRGIGNVSATTMVLEIFSWRTFKGGKPLGSFVGLTPTPYSSGGSQREQGISKAGRNRVRALCIEVAWLWLRYQPHSKLTHWFTERFDTGKRNRKIGIVALARRLLIALWNFVEKGIIPEGAALKGQQDSV
jgi:transposase